MKVFSVCGYSKSGKTTTIENIIKELSARGYKVGSIKEIHAEGFKMDPDPVSNTNRHRAAGSLLVCARGNNETDIMFPEKLPVSKILSFYEGVYDWVVMEGVDDIPVPTIVTAHNEEDLLANWSDMAFCVSGRVTSVITKYQGKPALDATVNIEGLVDLIERKVYKRLPNFPPECCMACGMTCGELGQAILGGKKRRSDCVADIGLELICAGRPIDMVPFVQNILRNAVLGVVSELEGYEKGGSVEIKL